MVREEQRLAAGEECNKYDLTVGPCHCADRNDWSRWVAISSLSPIWRPRFSFMDAHLDPTPANTAFH